MNGVRVKEKERESLRLAVRDYKKAYEVFKAEGNSESAIIALRMANSAEGQLVKSQTLNS